MKLHDDTSTVPPREPARREDARTVTRLLMNALVCLPSRKILRTPADANLKFADVASPQQTAERYAP
jgi:hypothetical protein